MRAGPVRVATEDLQEIGVHEHVARIHVRHLTHTHELRDEIPVGFVDDVDDARDVVMALGPVGSYLLTAEVLRKLQ